MEDERKTSHRKVDRAATDGLTDLDRLAVRERPVGRPLMHQSWGKLLFMHWRVDAERLRALVPKQLEMDTFDGSAWIAIAPFTMWDTRALPGLLPPIPGFSCMHELNVRTYVHFDRVPGVWFFSLDCNSAAAVLGARAFYFLPYYKADIELKQEALTIDYALVRTDEPPRGARPGRPTHVRTEFRAVWTIGERIPVSEPGSLEFFLTERYCLYSERAGEIYRARIHHAPWPLQKAGLSLLSSTMIESLGLATPKDDPLLHYAEELKVDIWPIRKAH
jgi:uncharacterized protein YqjF (DUF2071 family)